VVLKTDDDFPLHSVLAYLVAPPGRRFFDAGGRVPVGRLLELVGHVQQLGFAKIVADDLQADGTLAVLACAETAGIDMPGRPARLVDRV
jgi:hypothetical protein